LDEHEDGTIKESFAVGYGEFKENDAEKTKEVLADTLEYAKEYHHEYLEKYLLEWFNYDIEIKS